MDSSESDLVARAREGDGDAYAALVEPHQEIAFRVAYLVTGTAAGAEDATDPPPDAAEARHHDGRFGRWFVRLFSRADAPRGEAMCDVREQGRDEHTENDDHEQLLVNAGRQQVGLETVGEHHQAEERPEDGRMVEQEVRVGRVHGNGVSR